jgi:hypothetical protein
MVVWLVMVVAHMSVVFLEHITPHLYLTRTLQALLGVLGVLAVLRVLAEQLEQVELAVPRVQ